MKVYEGYWSFSKLNSVIRYTIRYFALISFKMIIFVSESISFGSNLTALFWQIESEPLNSFSCALKQPIAFRLKKFKSDCSKSFMISLGIIATFSISLFLLLKHIFDGEFCQKMLKNLR